MKEVQEIVRSKEFSNVENLKIGDRGEGLSFSREGRGCRGVSKLNSIYKSNVKCFSCHKIDHFMRDYPEMKGNDDHVHIGVVFDKYGYESVGALCKYNIAT